MRIGQAHLSVDRMAQFFIHAHDHIITHTHKEIDEPTICPVNKGIISDGAVISPLGGSYLFGLRQERTEGFGVLTWPI